MGVDLNEAFTPDDAVPRDPHTLLFVGRLVNSKRPERIIQLLHLLHEEFPQLQARVIGDGPERENLEVLAQTLEVHEQITFAGSKTQEEVRDEMRRATLLVFPSVREGLGMTVIEAMGCGCPVASLPLPSLDLVLRSRRTAWLVEKDSESDWATIVADALKADRERELRAITARTEVVKHFDWQQAAAGYRQLFQEIYRDAV